MFLSGPCRLSRLGIQSYLELPGTLALPSWQPRWDLFGMWQLRLCHLLALFTCHISKGLWIEVMFLHERTLCQLYSPESECLARILSLECGSSSLVDLLYLSAWKLVLTR